MSKLILTHEVTGLGAPGDVVDVKNGFARNYLIPQGFAVAWTRGGGQVTEEPWAASAPDAAGGDVWNTPGSYTDETPF